jgi:hypothetical protein
MMQRTKTLCHVRKLWLDEYVLSLRETTQKHVETPRIQTTTQPAKGDIVFLKESSPRGTWKLGIIEKLITSKDGEVLAATVGTASGKVLNRALNFLYQATSQPYPRKLLRTTRNRMTQKADK